MGIRFRIGGGWLLCLAVAAMVVPVSGAVAQDAQEEEMSVPMPAPMPPSAPVPAPRPFPMAPPQPMPLPVIGKPADASDYPWMVGLNTAEGQRPCGATLITPLYLLTAAHCVDLKPGWDLSGIDLVPISNMRAYRATNTFAEVEVALDPDFEPLVHSKYKAGDIPFHFDAALLRLAEPISTATPIPASALTVGIEDVVVSGWGYHPSGDVGRFRSARLSTASNAACATEAEAHRLYNWVTGDTICTLDSAVEACKRDSGGPLVRGSRQRPQIVGIVSWGARGACGLTPKEGRLLNGYTRVERLAEWLLENAKCPEGVADRQRLCSSPVTEARPGTLMQID